MASKQLAVFRVKYQFDEAILVARCAGFAGSRERKFPNFDLVPGFLSLGFSHANTRNFWKAIGATRNVSVVDGFGRVACDFFDTRDTFSRCDVSQ